MTRLRYFYARDPTNSVVAFVIVLLLSAAALVITLAITGYDPLGLGPVLPLVTCAVVVVCVSLLFGLRSERWLDPDAETLVTRTTWYGRPVRVREYELQGLPVILEAVTRSVSGPNASHPMVIYPVVLPAGGQEFTLLESPELETARERALELARLLDVQLEDRTDPEPRTLDVSKVDARVRAREGRKIDPLTLELPPLPPHRRLRVTLSGDELHVDVPPPQLQLGEIVAHGGLALACLGLFALFWTQGPWACSFGPGVAILLLALFQLQRRTNREILALTQDHIVLRDRSLLRSSTQSVPLSAVQEIRITEKEPAGEDLPEVSTPIVAVVTDETRLLLGEEWSSEEREWLRELLAAAVEDLSPGPPATPEDPKA